MQQLTITRPDDWHLHLRDGALLNTTVPAARVFNRSRGDAKPGAAGDDRATGTGISSADSGGVTARARI